IQHQHLVIAVDDPPLQVTSDVRINDWLRLGFGRGGERGDAPGLPGGQTGRRVDSMPIAADPSCAAAAPGSGPGYPPKRPPEPPVEPDIRFILSNCLNGDRHYVSLAGCDIKFDTERPFAPHTDGTGFASGGACPH